MDNQFEVKPLDPTPVEPAPQEKPPMGAPEVPRPPVSQPSQPTPPPPAAPPLQPSKESFFSKMSPVKWIIGIIVFTVIAILLISLFSTSFKESGIVLKVEGPEQIQSGEEVTFKVIYENNSDTELNNVSLNFLYPGESIVIKDGEVKESLTENVDIGVIETGEKGEIEFKGYIVGEAGAIKVAKARLSYKPANIRSEFEKAADLSITITSFAIPLTLSAPPSAISGQTITYTLDYRNESNSDFEDLRVKFKYPSGFTPIRFSPSPDEGEDIWVLDSLKKGDGSRIMVTGNLIGRENEEKVIVVDLQRRIDGNNINFEKAIITTTISSPPLLIDISVNDRKEFIANPGEQLAYDIDFTNTSRSTLSGINLIVRIDGNSHDVSSYNGDGFFNSDDNTILWNASVVPELANFEPGQTANVRFRISVRDPLPVSFSAKNFFIKLTASLETTNVPSEFDLDKLVVSQESLTKIRTDLKINQTVHYNDPAAGFVNSGPIPPKVGERTTYTVHWTLSGTSNDIVGAKITASLPPGVTWTDQTSVNANQPPVTFDSSTGEVTWNIQVVPAGTGSVLPTYQAIFQISINPTPAQKGVFMELIRRADFKGQDGFTKEEVKKFAFRATTDTVVDQLGKGRVE